MTNLEVVEDSGLVGCCYGYSVVVVSFGFFLLLHRLVKQYAIPETIDEKDRWRWKNILLSWIHASIIGAWVLSCFWFYPEITDDLIEKRNLYIYTAISFSTGYFVSDSVDLMTSGQVRVLWPIAIHHVVVLWIFFYNLTHCYCLGYTIVALIVELNSIFLHLRKLMKLAKVSRDNTWYRVNVIVTLLTIVTCRFSALGWISYGIVTSYHRFSTFFLYPLSLSIVVMWIIYVMSFYHIFVSEFLSKKSPGEAKNISSNGLVSNGRKSSNGKSE